MNQANIEIHVAMPNGNESPTYIYITTSIIRVHNNLLSYYKHDSSCNFKVIYTLKLSDCLLTSRHTQINSATQHITTKCHISSCHERFQKREYIVVWQVANYINYRNIPICTCVISVCKIRLTGKHTNNTCLLTLFIIQ